MLVVHEGHRRVRAHPAGVGTGVAVADPLEVLRGRERREPLAVAEHQQRALATREPLLDHHPCDRPHRRRRPESLASTSASASSIESVTSTPLPAARPSVLTTHGPGRERRNVLRLVHLRADREAGGRHARLGQHLLHERLRPLEPGAVGTGPEHQATRRPQPVGEAVDERCLGTDRRRGRRRSPPAGASTLEIRCGPRR